MFYAMSSLGVLFLVHHLLESTLLLLSPADWIVVAIHALPYRICAQSQCLLVFSSRSCVRSLRLLCGPWTSLVVSFSDITGGTHSAFVQFSPSSSMFHRQHNRYHNCIVQPCLCATADRRRCPNWSHALKD